MYLSEIQVSILKSAIELIKKRKRGDIKSAIINAQDIIEENNKKSYYHYQQIIRSIGIPFAVIFFLSHSFFEKDVVEKLATFIEDNTNNIVPL
jgi:methionine salvage enolase-phosphatase E1